MLRPPWPRRPLPARRGEVWLWNLCTVAQLPHARAALRSRLGALGTTPDRRDMLEEQLVLAFDELASNALRHGETPVVATVVAAADECLLDVCDASPESMPRPAEGRDPALGGLGLHLVAHLADDHGWYVDGDRKHVWACLSSWADDRQAAYA